MKRLSVRFFSKQNAVGSDFESEQTNDWAVWENVNSRKEVSEEKSEEQKEETRREEREEERRRT